MKFTLHLASTIGLIDTIFQIWSNEIIVDIITIN